MLEAPPRLLTQGLQLGPAATFKVYLAEEDLQQAADRRAVGSATPVALPQRAAPARQEPEAEPPTDQLVGQAAKQPRKQQQKKQAERLDDTASAGKQKQQRRGSGRGSPSAAPRHAKDARRLIAPKDNGLLPWYTDAVHAAEQAHRQTARGPRRGALSGRQPAQACAGARA